MNHFKRAFISIKRNIAKTILLFLLVFVLSSVISGTISANQAMVNTERNLLERMPTIARISLNWPYINELDLPVEDRWNLQRELTSDMLREVATLPYIRHYDFFTRASLYYSGLQFYDPGGRHALDHVILTGGDTIIVTPEDGGDPLIIAGHQPGILGRKRKFSLHGVNNPNLFDIQSGLIELVSGRVFTEYEIHYPAPVALISEGFANTNQLTIGSVIPFRNIVTDLPADWLEDPNFNEADHIFAEESYDVTIIGIFRILYIETDIPWVAEDIVYAIGNRIYVTNAFVDRIDDFRIEHQREVTPSWFIGPDGQPLDDDELFWNPIENFFTLHDAADFPALRQAITEIVPPYFHLVSSSGGADVVAHALSTMRSLTAMILILAVGASLLILTLLITLFLRDRKHEVGVYLALGEKKGHLIVQFVMELMVIAITAIVFALFVGNVMSANLSENMLLRDIAEQEVADPWGMRVWDDNPFLFDGYVCNVDTDAILAGYDVSLTPQTILIFFIVALGTILLATVIPMIYVLRMNPKKIMM